MTTTPAEHLEQAESHLATAEHCLKRQLYDRATAHAGLATAHTATVLALAATRGLPTPPSGAPGAAGLGQE
jgi:hypothetical protein